MANPELGAKQVCPNCQAKFYDLNRRPAHCPKCGTDFDPEEALKLRGRRVRPGYPADDEDVEDQVKDKAADSDDDEEEDVRAPEIDEEGHEPILTPDDDDDASDNNDDAGMNSSDGDDDDVLDDDDDDSVPFIEDDDDDSIDEDIAKPSRDDD
ncbi:MAG: TIGR02300 family protein [Brevundimonas sp.]|uniref:TIGR02300 family protein n=1 Tax=Brevundimonas sp. TaxID=1871086 RepID=UPI002589C073|nr:TIGR02300 family protein [Brevundimonas sp.]MCV0415680.1 TIGR02300 family protein [Brevundimonas sp.]